MVDADRRLVNIFTQNQLDDVRLWIVVNGSMPDSFSAILLALPGILLALSAFGLNERGGLLALSAFGLNERGGCWRCWSWA